MENNSIVQWNCNGFPSSRIDDLDSIFCEFRPSVLCLNHTNFHMDKYHSIRGFEGLHYFIPDYSNIGGVSMYIRSAVRYNQVNLTTNLQCLAVTISLGCVFTICTLYVPPSYDLSYEDVSGLIEQLPRPFIVVGDINARSVAWDNCTNSNGRIVEDIIDHYGLGILNDNRPTFISGAHLGSFSTLDIAFCSPSLLHFLWDTIEDTYSSDHFPTRISFPHEYYNHASKLNIKKADWQKFNILCLTKISQVDFSLVDEPMKLFSKILNDIARECIPKIHYGSKKICKPWFNNECREAIKLRRKLLRTFRTFPTLNNFLNYKRCNSTCKRIIKKAKRESWSSFTSTLNSRTNPHKVWKHFNSIKGRSNLILRPLKKNENYVYEIDQIIDLIGHQFEFNSSESPHDLDFIATKSKMESNPINFASNIDHAYNNLFTIKELRDAIAESKDSACGPDGIYNQFLKHLPPSCLRKLLFIYNLLWNNSYYPSEWRNVYTIPILKPDKSPHHPNSYRPIALSSCLSKIMEKMINKRLIWFLESNNLLSAHQTGFRKNCTPIDQLIKFDTFCREAFVEGMGAVAVMFDLQKAYDSCWKYGILKDMFHFGLRGRLPMYISEFLRDRTFQVRFGSHMSKRFTQVMGVPQGSVLSPTLFLIKINSIVSYIKLNSNSFFSLHVDDFKLAVRGHLVSGIERNLQLNINRIVKFAQENGFIINFDKTLSMSFWKWNDIFMSIAPELYIGDNLIRNVLSTRFLGLILDRKLTYSAHIDYIKGRALKTLNLLKCLKGSDWGADKTCMLRIYRACIRSLLDYGCTLYNLAPKSQLDKLNTVQHQALRISTGAFRTSPSLELSVEANEAPLNIRRARLSMRFFIKVLSLKSSILYDTFTDPPLTAKFDKDNRIGNRSPFSMFMKCLFSDADINTECIEHQTLITFPPWTLNMTNVNLSLNLLPKKDTPPIIFKNYFHDIVSKYAHCDLIFTDGSKSDGRTGCAFVHQDRKFMYRLPDNASIFSAELSAISFSLDYVASNSLKNCLICSDSLSALTCIKNIDLSSNLIIDIMNKHDRLSKKGFFINFLWVPGHCGIMGNIKADEAARDSLSIDFITSKMNHRDFFPLINDYINYVWQSNWDAHLSNLDDNRLKPIHILNPKVSLSCKNYCAKVRDDIVLTRIKLGHTYSTHNFILKGGPPPFCVSCNASWNLDHILFSCWEFHYVRPPNFNSEFLYRCYHECEFDILFNFLKQIDLLSHI